MPFCFSPWSNIDISPQGNITPCCKFQTKYYDQKFNVQIHTIDQYLKSDFLNKIKQELQQEIWPRGCERCCIEEENNIASKRQLDFNRWRQHYQKFDIKNSTFITLSIAFGNTCNLTCITCNPHSSSRWQQEYREIVGIDIKPYHFYKDHFVDDLVKQAPNLVHIDIPGGEPFLSGIKEQKKLLNYYIENNQSQNITLHYTTNGTIFPDSEWWDLWKHFKEIDLQISVDGIESHYEYIRYPSNWQNLVTNVKHYINQEKILDNLRLSVSHTVSAYNIFYLDEFFNWCYNIGLPTPWLGRVHNPIHMRPTVWPDNVKKIIIKHLEQSKYSDVKNWINVLTNFDDSEFFELFKERTHKHDEYRSLSFAKTFPELAKYI